MFDGKNIESIHTLKSWNDNNCIEINTVDKTFRLDVESLIPLLDQVEFKIENKKVHSYLTPVCLILPMDRQQEIDESNYKLAI